MPWRRSPARPATGAFNKVFLNGIRQAVMGDPAWAGGWYGARPPVEGLRQIGRIYAGWGFSEAFYRKQIYKAFGHATLEQHIELFWEAFFLKCDANDLLAQMWTWYTNDLGDHPSFGGDFEKAAGQHHRAHHRPARLHRQLFPAA